MKPITKSVCSSAMRTVASVYAPVANAPAEDIWPAQNNTGLWSITSHSSALLFLRPSQAPQRSSARADGWVRPPTDALICASSLQEGRAAGRPALWLQPPH